MNSNDWKLLVDITFKTQSYRRNFDLVNENESFITECDGTISHIRLSEHKSPVQVGEYGISIWNIGMGMNFGVDFYKLLSKHQIEATYSELNSIIENNLFDFKKYDKVILIHSFILREDYRKRGITEEFVELVYRDFYDKRNIIIALVKPFQDNPIDADYFFHNKIISVRDDGSNKVDKIPAVEYYSLNNLLIKKDTEMNEYKLFSVATKCGFVRIDDSHLFMLSPEKTIERMKEKQKNIEIIEII
jgi:hypothetical protein